MSNNSDHRLKCGNGSNGGSFTADDLGLNDSPTDAAAQAARATDAAAELREATGDGGSEYSHEEIVTRVNEYCASVTSYTDDNANADQEALNQLYADLSQCVPRFYDAAQEAQQQMDSWMQRNGPYMRDGNTSYIDNYLGGGEYGVDPTQSDGQGSLTYRGTVTERTGYNIEQSVGHTVNNPSYYYPADPARGWFFQPYNRNLEIETRIKNNLNMNLMAIYSSVKYCSSMINDAMQRQAATENPSRRQLERMCSRATDIWGNLFWGFSERVSLAYSVYNPDALTDGDSNDNNRDDASWPADQRNALKSTAPFKRTFFYGLDDTGFKFENGQTPAVFYTAAEAEPDREYRPHLDL